MTLDQEDRMKDLITTLNLSALMRERLLPLTGEEDVASLSETLTGFLERVEHICGVELERLQVESGLADAQMRDLTMTTMKAVVRHAMLNAIDERSGVQ